MPPFFCLVKKFRMATHVLERREQLRSVLKAAVDAEALKREPLAEVSQACSGSARAGAADSRRARRFPAGRSTGLEGDAEAGAKPAA